MTPTLCRGHFVVAATLSLMVTTAAGCSSPSSDSPTADVGSPEPPRQDGLTAAEIMNKMVAVYRDADVYVDNAEYGEHFVLAGDGVQRQGPPLTVSVLFKRPNQFRITRVEPRSDGEVDAAVVACDGEKLEARISRLEPQRLSLPAPEEATLDTIAPDPLLKQGLFPVPVQDMFPQLALLLADKERTPWPLEGGDHLTLLAPKEIRARGASPLPCYRVQMQTTMGPQICWIDKQKFLLLRIELPSEELRKRIYPNHEFTSFSWRFDFYDATLDVPIPRTTFRLEADSEAPEAVLVTAFQELPAKDSGVDRESVPSRNATEDEGAPDDQVENDG
jgi:hypothetical protein